MLVNDETPVVVRDIAVRDNDRDSHGTVELETDSDSASGMSGGPLFGFFDDGPYIIGVMSGRETETDWTSSSFDRTHTVFAGWTTRKFSQMGQTDLASVLTNLIAGGLT